MEKYAARSVKQQIDRILWEVWDPIGVNKISPAPDEYSGDVNGVPFRRFFEICTCISRFHLP
jgi:hypothetical protein